MLHRELALFAGAHHGLVTHDAARRAGVSRSGWYRLIEAGHVDPVFPNVARMIGHPPSREQRILAAVLSIEVSSGGRTTALASHRSAAFLLGLPRPVDDPVDVIVTDRVSRRLRGVVVHRPTDLADLTPTFRRGVPCTNELRTLVDLGAVDAAAVRPALDAFAASRRLTATVIAALIDRHAGKGRRGVGALQEAYADWPLAEQVADSVLELAMARLLRSHRLPPATFHAHVAGYEVDFLIEGSPVVIECDGWTFHVADRNRWERDLDRDAALSAAGYVVLRRSRGQIVGQPTATAQRIRALLERWAPQLLGR